MPRSKDPTPQASLFDGPEMAAAAPSRLIRAEQLARLIVADVEQIRALIRELHPPKPKEPDDS